ncbi:MAG: CDP-alcohol phosphatidyltransferase family protein [Candidatus Latescibacterota bacterium]
MERQVRELARRGVVCLCIWVSPGTARAAARLRPDLGALFDVHLDFRTVPEAGLGACLGGVDGDLVLLEGDVVYDERLIVCLLQGGPGTAVAGEGGTVALWLDPSQARRLGGRLQGRGILGPGELAAAAAELGLRLTAAAELDPYVPALRLTLPPFAVRVGASDDLRALDHLMYRRTFKGVIDAVARYGYYHLVRWLTRRLSFTGVTPNVLTVLSVLAVWAVVPCFATGRFGLGVGLAWAGVLLDSVDGKLARLRLHHSERMGAFEHLAAMPGLGLWYAAVGWHLCGGHLMQTHGWAALTWALLAVFLLDKGVTGGFRALWGRELFDYERLDARFHLVAARRNVSLVMLTVGAGVGRIGSALVAVAAWTGATLAFHALRFAWGSLALRRTAGARRRRSASA